MDSGEYKDIGQMAKDGVAQGMSDANKQLIEAVNRWREYVMRNTCPVEHDAFIEPLKACIKLGFYWLTKNRNGECFASRMQPVKGLHGWFLNTEYVARLNPLNILTHMVEWEDPEPVSVLKELNKRNATV